MGDGERRVHSPSMMRSLFNFKSLLELFGVLHDVVAGHEYLSQHGVHREISLGNILITGQDSPNRGLLIDLDIAEPRKHINMEYHELSETLNFTSAELIPRGRFPSPSWNTYFPDPADPDLSMSEPEVSLLDDSEAEAEPLKKPAVPVALRHAAHHDLEALFWTLCYLCIIMEGPGVVRKTWPHHARNAIRWYFDQEDPDIIAMKKDDVIRDPGKFEIAILASFSPYFEPCKRFVTFLYDKLRRAYQTRKFTRLHQTFRNTFKRAILSRRIQVWHSKRAEWREMEEDEGRRREENKPGKSDSLNVDGARASKSELEGKRACEDEFPERREATNSFTPGSGQPRTKRQKRISLNAEPSNSPVRSQTAMVPPSTA